MYFKRIVFNCLFFIFLYSCGSVEKKYEDYKENEFYEVQGIITKIFNSSDLFDSPRVKTIFYDYHLELPVPIQGKEENIDLVLKAGDLIVVLVHEKDITVSFFGRYGIIDENLEMK